MTYAEEPLNAAQRRAEAKRRRVRQRNLRWRNPEPTEEEYDTRSRLVYLMLSGARLYDAELAELDRINTKLGNALRARGQYEKQNAKENK